ncbi:MAG: aldehyde dehydrogenase family protein [Comamonadaceae bacterium]|nr:aldehyde dehydrogenase family protein [Comamonadaceae bacterium]
MPWNYPLYLAVGAAGRRPGRRQPRDGEDVARYTPRTWRSCFADLVRALLPARRGCGGRQAARTSARAFAELPFDHLLFTGSDRGRPQRDGAPRRDNLTPVTLELGGKSPAIVGAGLPGATRRPSASCSASTLNAGQTCIAPDHVLLPRRQDRGLRRRRRAQMRAGAAIRRWRRRRLHARSSTQRHFAAPAGCLDDAREQRRPRRCRCSTARRAATAPRARIAPHSLLDRAATTCTVMQRRDLRPAAADAAATTALDEAIAHVNAAAAAAGAVLLRATTATRVERVLRRRHRPAA